MLQAIGQGAESGTEIYPRTNSNLTFKGHGSIHQVDQLFADRKAQACALVTPGIPLNSLGERLEQELLGIIWDSTTCVRYRKNDSPLIVFARC